MVRIQKSILLKFLLLFFLFSLISVGVEPRSRANEEPVVKIGIAYYPPWMKYGNGEITGYDIDMFQALFENLGMKVEFVPLTFSKLLEGLKSGEVDIVSSILFREERNKFIRYVSPSYRTESEVNFYALRNSGIKVDKYRDLAGLKVSVSKGVQYFPTFDLDDRMVKVEFSSPKESFEALVRGEVDLTVCSKLSGDCYLKEIGIEDKVRSCIYNYSPKSTTIYLGISRKSPLVNRADEIGAVIRKFKERGLLDSLAKKYSVAMH